MQVTAKTVAKPDEELPELFLAIVAPAGSDLATIERHLQEQLEQVGYDLRIIKLSDRLKDWKKIDPADQYERIETLMEAGDDFRKLCGLDAVARLGLKEVIETRAKAEGKGIAYLFKSLKTPEEVKTLRNLYGQSFYAISIFSEKEKRLKQLVNRFNTRPNKETDAAHLSNRDETDQQKPNGQNVRETFPFADLFLNVDKVSDAKAHISRFVQLLFGNTFRTPTQDEYAMFFAQGAAYRSADLGRQVGAAVASTAGDILSLGTNEVPVFNGGQFWDKVEPGLDPRDCAKETDWNSQKQRELVKDLLERIQKAKELGVNVTDVQIDKILEGLFSEKRNPELKGAEVLSVIGFYRSVHGETAALLDAARRGVSVKGATLYVTAFPCHECARHILAAGIKKVLYIEPYPKSLAQDQYPEFISVSEGGDASEKLHFEPFVGIAPRQYMYLFAKNKRKKKDGTVIHWKPKDAKLRYGRNFLFYREVEKQLSDDAEKGLSQEALK